MKATVKVSISSIAFNIDNDAYSVLKQYLDALKAHFGKKPDGKEIVEDIESRLAELLLIRTDQTEKVVTLDDANEVIGIMGKPSDMYDDEDSTNENRPPQQPATLPAKKRLYRDVDNKVFAGVCSGLGNYFNADPVIFRIIFVVLTLALVPIRSVDFLQSIGIMTYIVLWICLPKATTPEQKLEMKGEDMSIDNIERQVREELHNNESRPLRPHVAGNAIAKILEISFRIIGGFIMLGAILGIVVIIGFTFGMNFTDNIFWDSQLIIGPDSIYEYSIGLFIALVPLFLTAYFGAKALFWSKLRLNNMIAACVIFCLWIGVICFLAGKGFQHDIFTEKNPGIISKEYYDLTSASDTLFVNIDDIYNNDTSNNANDNNINIDIDSGRKTVNINFNQKESRLWLGKHDGMQSIFFIPEVKVRYKNNIDNYQVAVQKKKHKGKNSDKSTYQVDYIQLDSLLLIKPMVFNKQNKWKGDKIEFIIYAPENKKVIIQEPLLSKNKEKSAETKLEETSITINN